MCTTSCPIAYPYHDASTGQCLATLTEDKYYHAALTGEREITECTGGLRNSITRACTYGTCELGYMSQSTSCVTSCSEGYFASGTRCLTECGPDMYGDTVTRTCVSTCPSTRPYYSRHSANDLRCSSSCPLYHEYDSLGNSRCVDSCQGYVDMDEFRCIDVC